MVAAWMVGAFPPKCLHTLGAPVSEGEVVDAVLVDLLLGRQMGTCHLSCWPCLFFWCSEFLWSWDLLSRRWGVLTLKNLLGMAALVSASTRRPSTTTISPMDVGR